MVLKIRQLNGSKVDKEAPFCPETIRNVPGLTLVDWATFGDWLLQQDSTYSSVIVEKLQQLRLRRYIRWHLQGAPDRWSSQR